VSQIKGLKEYSYGFPIKNSTAAFFLIFLLIYGGKLLFFIFIGAFARIEKNCCINYLKTT
jgi:hypothetical protein